METLATYLITAFIITGIWVTMQSGMIFSRIGDACRRLPYEWMKKPLCECVICMTSVWGISIYVTLWSNCIDLAIIPYLFGVAGILTIISFAIGE